VANAKRSCPQTTLEGGLQRLHSADDVATESVAKPPVFYGSSFSISILLSRLTARPLQGEEFSRNLGTRKTGI